MRKLGPYCTTLSICKYITEFFCRELFLANLMVSSHLKKFLSYRPDTLYRYMFYFLKLVSKQQWEWHFCFVFVLFYNFHIKVLACDGVGTRTLNYRYSHFYKEGIFIEGYWVVAKICLGKIIQKIKYFLWWFIQVRKYRKSFLLIVN